MNISKGNSFIIKNFSSIISVIDFLKVVDTFALRDKQLYVLFSFLTFKTNSFPKAEISKLSVQSFCVFLNLTLSLFINIFETGINCFALRNKFSFDALTISIYLLLKYKLL